MCFVVFDVTVQNQNSSLTALSVGKKKEKERVSNRVNLEDHRERVSCFLFNIFSVFILFEKNKFIFLAVVIKYEFQNYIRFIVHLLFNLRLCISSGNNVFVTQLNRKILHIFLQ